MAKEEVSFVGLLIYQNTIYLIFSAINGQKIQLYTVLNLSYTRSKLIIAIAYGEESLSIAEQKLKAASLSVNCDGLITTAFAPKKWKKKL